MSPTSPATTTDAASRAALLKVFSGLVGVGGGLAAGGVVLLAGGGAARTAAGVLVLILGTVPLLAALGLARDPGARATVAARLAGQGSDRSAGMAGTAGTAGGEAGPVLPARGAGEVHGPVAVDRGGELSEGFTVAGNRAQRRAASRGSKRTGKPGRPRG